MRGKAARASLAQCVIGAAALAGASAGQAQDLPETRFVDLAEVDRAVAAFIGPSASQAQPADRRLRLSPCPQALAVSWHDKQRRTVEVACRTKDGWRIYVPVGPSRPPSSGFPAVLVSRGSTVTVRIAGHAFSVAVPGQALADGEIGGVIAVRVRGASTILRGRVEPDGSVAIMKSDEAA